MPIRVVEKPEKEPTEQMAELSHMKINFFKGSMTIGKTPGYISPPEISLRRYNHGTLLFQRNFSLSTGTLQAPDRLVDWTDLEAMMTANHGDLLVAYFGLEGDALQYGFRSMTLAGETYSADLSVPGNDLPTHKLTSTGRVVAIQPPEDWRLLQDAYYRRMQVARLLGEAATNVDRHNDPKCIIYPWTNEVRLMFETNRGLSAHAQLYLANFSIDHQPSNEAPRGFEGPEGYRHGLCFYAQDNSGKMLSDSYVSLYNYNGTDLGFLCPPRCRKTTQVGNP